MHTSKTRNGPSDVPQRTSPATPRSSRVAKTGGNDTDSTGAAPTRTPTERSPKVTERRSPRSPITEKKRPSRISELESQVSQLQDELKKAKDQLSLLETRKRHAQQEAEEAKKQAQAITAKLEDSQRQLVEFSAAEESRLQELRKISQERDRAWQSELEALQKQQSVDAAALSSAMSEVQRLKQQLEMAAVSEAARAKQFEEAESELEGLKQEMEVRLATIEGLKVHVSDSDNAAAEAKAMVTESKQQLEMAKATIDSLLSEGVRLQECLSSKDAELEESRARFTSLEESLKKVQAMGHANGSSGGNELEIEHLRSALEAAEMKYQEEQTRKTIEAKTTYEMLENVKSEYGQKVSDLELELKNKNDELAELKAALADKEQNLQKMANSNKRSDVMSEMQPELESKLMKSITDITELKANLMDKENALQSVMEENETLKSEIGRKEAEVQGKYEAAVAELELAKAAEQDVRMRLGYVTEEADKSSRRAARAAEQLDAAQAVNSEMEAELRRLRVQSDQWRKAAEAAAAALTGGNNGRLTERTGSLEPEYNSIGGKLMSSPFSDDLDDESPKRRNSSVLRRMSGLWKKSPK